MGDTTRDQHNIHRTYRKCQTTHNSKAKMFSKSFSKSCKKAVVALMLLSSVGMASQVKADDIYGSHGLAAWDDAKTDPHFSDVHDAHLTPLEDIKEGAIPIGEALLDDIGGGIQVEKEFDYDDVDHSLLDDIEEHPDNYGRKLQMPSTSGPFESDEIVGRKLQASAGPFNVAKILLKATTGAKDLAHDANDLIGIGGRKLQASAGPFNVAKILLKATTGAKDLAHDANDLIAIGGR